MSYQFIWVWTIWFLLILATFGLLEGFAIQTNRPTLSRTVWVFTKNFPPFNSAICLVVGFLIAHFFWPGQGCDIVK